MIILKFLMFFIIPNFAFGLTFNQAVENIIEHDSIKLLESKTEGIKESADAESSWADPKFRIIAKNFPKNNLKDDQSPMTGVEFGFAQKVPLTNKYNYKKNAIVSLAEAGSFDANDKKELYTKFLWEVLISQKQIQKELQILKENLSWIGKILKVSKRLYATGKITQQGVLDIQIRKAEIESAIETKKVDLLQISDKLLYLVGGGTVISESIPWRVLSQTSKNNKLQDFKELSLKEKIRSKEFTLTASKLNYIPDITVSIGYTKRSDIDSNGDFVSAGISFPLPFSSEKYSRHGKAVQESYAAKKAFDRYKKKKHRNLAVLEKEILKNQKELLILKNKTIRFAKSSRQITSKSYGLGNSTYVELLQSELKLQEKLMQKIMLEASLDVKRVNLKYLKGESLSE